MTRQECGKLVITASAYHPNTFKTDEQMDQTITAWYYVLQDIDFKAAMNALVSLESSGTLTYFPTVGMVRNAAIPITKGESYMSEGEALALYRKAIADGNYHAQEWFDRFPPEMQRAVGTPSNLAWDNNFMGDYDAGVQESQFLRRYRQTLETMRNEARMPEGILRLIERKRQELTAARQQEGLTRAIPMERREEPEDTQPLPEGVEEKLNALYAKWGRQ